MSENQFTFENPEYRATYWHTCSHVLAQAMKRLHPEVKLAIGPSIENGFYYDFDTPAPFSPEQLEELEAEMRKICKEKLKLERFELPREEAIKFMEEKEEPYKVELINDLPEDAVISFYKQGEFTDLCAGPHLDSTGRIKGNAIKLTACNAAYWRGDSNRQTLQRIYGIAFPKKDELDEYLKQQEEALKRDHNKLGRELEYFTTVDVIGQGLPILLPKGARTIQVLQRWVEDVEQESGYQLTKTPYFAKRELYKLSGHWDHYRDGMFIMGDPDDETKDCFAMRPMTCPFQYQVFLNRGRSYRDLPMRLGETSTLFRNEDSGEMHGLIRVRQFTISEGHLILRPEQLEEEFKGCLDLAKYCLGTVGLLDKCTFRFSQWDPANPNNKYEGTKEQWDEAQRVMGQILDDLGVEYEIGIDEAAFYGPKLDIQYKNVYGKEDTLVTIQIDMLLAKRYGMEYVDVDGRRPPPTSSTAPAWAATSGPWPTSSRSTPAPCPAGWPPSRSASCPSPTGPPTTAPSWPGTWRTAASGSRWTTATRRSARRSGTPSWRRSPTWWWWATGTWRTAPSLPATAPPATWAPCPSRTSRPSSATWWTTRRRIPSCKAEARSCFWS